MIKDEKSAKNIGGYLRKKNLLHVMKENPGLKKPPLPMVGLINIFVAKRNYDQFDE